MKRETQINTNSYKEVTLLYRIHRAIKLDNKNIKNKENRFVCPVVEAGRSNDAYGQPFIPDLKAKDLNNLSNAFEISSLAVKMIAYFSGKKSSIISNILFGKFDDKDIKNGLIHTLKNGINTGIYKDGKFSYDGFNAYISFIHPELKDISLTNDWLYSTNADNLYVEDSHLSKILEFNEKNKTSKKVGIGLTFSKFEMNSLLLNLLSQDLKNHPTGKKGILVRDIHDLYKYGFMPAVLEEKLISKNLLPNL